LAPRKIRNKEELVGRIRKRLRSDPTISNTVLVKTLHCSTRIIEEVREELGIFYDVENDPNSAFGRIK
jgi:hypothetical protein